MVYRGDSMKFSLTFEDRSYKFGETVDLAVFGPTSDATIRSARIDLVCEQKYSNWEGVPQVVSGARLSMTSISQGGGSSSNTEEAVHSSHEFLRDTRLSSDGDTRFLVKLDIERKGPSWAPDEKLLRRAKSSSMTFDWFLVLNVDVRMGRNSSTRSKINISGF